MVRAHLPFIPYQMNHRYKKIYALLHKFGDEETKQSVQQFPFLVDKKV